MKKYQLVIAVLFGLGIASVNAQYIVLLNFNTTNGSYPTGSLVKSGKMLYGMTASGGTLSEGCVFAIDTNGVIDSNLHSFNGVDGSHPMGSLTLIGNKLYGTTTSGGPSHYGNIFRVNTDGTGFKSIFKFNGTDGNSPESNLILIGGKLYGTTASGGANDSGCVFSIDTNGSGYLDLHDFVSKAKGEEPYCTLAYSSGMLYGTSGGGGADNVGCIFSLDTTGTTYNDIFDFDTLTGYSPGSVIVSGNKLFGMADFGGLNNKGLVYSVNTNGTGFKDLLDFNGTNGESPFGALTQSGNLLYGMTYMGGTSGGGTIFSIDTSGNSFTNLYNFNVPNGQNPEGEVTVSGNMLYGMANSSGTNNVGVIFSMNTAFTTPVNYYAEAICIATVDTATNKAEVIWGRTNSPPQGGNGYYKIYRDSNSVYVPTHTQPLNVMSDFVDMNSNPSAGPVSYELSTVDSSGESQISSNHRTVFLTAVADSNRFNLSWTQYIGFLPSRYRIFRGPALNAMVQIDSVPLWQLTYTDSFPTVNPVYAIEAVNPAGACIPTVKIKTHNSLATLSGAFSNGVNTAVLSGVQSIDGSIPNLTIYPNPTNGVFNLTYTLTNVGNVNISIIDELGQVVYANAEQRSAGQTNEQINLENISTGIYSLRLQTTSGIKVKKLVVIKK